MSRLGTADVTMTDYESKPPIVEHLWVDCSTSRPRSEIHLTLRSATEVSKTKVITDGQNAYILDSESGDKKRLWSRWRISELDTFTRKDGTSFHHFFLYVANCDQPATLALFSKHPRQLAAPGMHQATIDSRKAAHKSKGYAKSYYTFMKGMAAYDLRTSLWLGRNFRPTGYRITLKTPQAPTTWEVRFNRWRNDRIKVPRKSAVWKPPGS